MNKKIIILSFIVVAILIIGSYFIFWGKARESGQVALGGKEVMVYKTSTCGCCGAFISYLKKKDVAVKMENVTDLDAVKRQYGVPSELSSCHTSIVDGYVVEGHVPFEAIEKLLNERPNIKGIALPGMPSGTPGMPGPKFEKWDIRSFTEDGTVGTFTII
ncbi:MAG: DUF411 domain-containing protein [bacterium]|jgi:hypothetical protein|nr:DUF411 domain-containing protein [bacterium]